MAAQGIGGCWQEWAGVQRSTAWGPAQRGSSRSSAWRRKGDHQNTALPTASPALAVLSPTGNDATKAPHVDKAELLSVLSRSAEPWRDLGSAAPQGPAPPEVCASLRSRSPCQAGALGSCPAPAFVWVSPPCLMCRSPDPRDQHRPPASSCFPLALT